MVELTQLLTIAASGKQVKALRCRSDSLQVMCG